MKRLLTFAFLGLLLASGACDTVVEDCGPFQDKFKTTGFNTTTYRIDASASSDAEPDLFVIENDTLSAGEFAIRMVPQKELYYSSSKASTGVSFVSAAYACSPPIPSSDEVIQNIRIYSGKAFNSEYSAEDNLADLFDVLVLNRSKGMIYERFSLKGFLASEPNAVDELILVLNSVPKEVSDHRFTVKYSQDGRGVDDFEFTTDAVVLEAS